MPRIDFPIRGWRLGVALFFALALRALCEPADGVPVAHAKARYQALRANSPFSLASAPAATPAPQASFAANWYVSGIARIGDSDFVTIKSRDLATAFSLYAGESANANDVALVGVSWSDIVGKSTVLLRKGTETARLEFNEAELRAAPPAVVAAQPAPNGAALPPLPRAAGSNAPAVNGLRSPGNPQIGAAPNRPPAPRRRAVPIQPPQ